MLKQVSIGMAGAVLLLGGSIAGAAPVTFFGEDPATTGVLGPNSAAARSDFLGNLRGSAARTLSHSLTASRRR